MAAKKKPRAVSLPSKARAPVAPASLIAHLQETIAGIVKDFGPSFAARCSSPTDGS